MNPKDTVFIDLRTDFGFKRLFGSPERSGLLIRFLNALFEGRMKVTRVTFQNKEMLPPDPDGKRTVYDIYCTTETGHHFILEMQMSDTENFPKRVLFYTATAIVNQGRRGVNYALNPVYTVVFTNFNLKSLPQRLISEVVLQERFTHEIYSEDMELIFISLPQVKEHWQECETEIERIVYLIKNMHTMDKKSKPYETGEYNEFFEASDCGNLVNEEWVAYSDSYYKMLDNMEALEYSKKEARAEGRAEGIEEGRILTIRQMLDAGISPATVKQITGIDPSSVGL